MSIKIMSRVWEQSSHEGSPLLLLLALADHASDDGVCWPGIPRLAHKTRKTKRHTKRLLIKLEESGEVYIAREIGRGNTNMYYITLGFSEEEIVHTLIKRFEFDPAKAAQIAKQVIQLQEKGDAQDTFLDEEEDEKGDIQGQEKVTPGAEKVTPGVQKDDIAVSPESSSTVIEPSEKNRQKDADSFCKKLEDEPFDAGTEKMWEQYQQTEANQKAGGNYAAPPSAGGDDGFQRGPVDAFCEVLAAILPVQLPRNKRRSWGNKLHEIAKEWSTDEVTITPEIMERAIRAIPDDSEIGWKSFSSPYSDNFDRNIGPLLLRDGQPREKKAPHRAPDPSKYDRATRLTLERLGQHGDR